MIGDWAAAIKSIGDAASAFFTFLATSEGQLWLKDLRTQNTEARKSLAAAGDWLSNLFKTAFQDAKAPRIP